MFPSRLFSSINSSSTDLSKLLDFKDSKYSSITVDMIQYSGPINSSDFKTKLAATIEHAKAMGKKCIYLNFNLKTTATIGLMSEVGALGFQFHRAEGDNAVLLLWIGSGECKVPIFASHHVGVGGALWSEGKVLVVRETGFNNIAGWKLPGGLADVGEELGDAASREIQEETGLKTTLDSVLGFRHSHNSQFGRSDIYVVCKMSLVDVSEKTLKLDSDEILEAKWMTLDELEAVNKAPLLKIIIDILRAGEGVGMVEKTVASVVPGREPFRLYHPKY